MSRAYSDIAFTPVVRDMQTQMGSRAGYEAFDHTDDRRDQLGQAEADFIQARDSFYQATVSETGWPYVQHRGGPQGFVRVLDAKTLAYADFRGNRQYISVGNLKTHDRVSIIFMDYANQRRLKILGRVKLVDEAQDPALVARLEVPSYRARVERAFVITVEAYDWNCPQHITPRYTEVEVRAVLDDYQSQIKQLQQQLDAAQHQMAQAAPLTKLGEGPLQLVVTGVRQLSPRVRAYELRDVHGQALPQVRAGAHLDVPVKLASGAVSHRRYSISSNPTRRDAYEIAVLREDAGSGGSAAVHETYQIGLVLACAMPGNDFPLVHADGPAVLVAAGIGITPIKAMALELQAQGRDFVLHYAYRSRQQAAYLDRLERQVGARLIRHDASESNKLDAQALLRDVPAGAHVYVCGPQGLIQAVRDAAQAGGVAPDRVHHEQFVAAAPAGQKPFVIHLAKAGYKVWVSAQASALQALEEAGVDLPSGCRTGTCGACAVKVQSGQVQHRDTVLTPVLKAAGLMCPCVSRAQSEELVLDL
ncbi:MAG: pyridoxamine 5'-phosphate oxidase family protein [Burkholderiales bacterium]|nr:pyridoxamine 5'-phosphate oxidase family protein [Burkholderiales bacterium]